MLLLRSPFFVARLCSVSRVVKFLPVSPILYCHHGSRNTSLALTIYDANDPIRQQFIGVVKPNRHHQVVQKKILLASLGINLKYLCTCARFKSK